MCIIWAINLFISFAYIVIIYIDVDSSADGVYLIFGLNFMHMYCVSSFYFFIWCSLLLLYIFTKKSYIWYMYGSLFLLIFLAFCIELMLKYYLSCARIMYVCVCWFTFGVKYIKKNYPLGGEFNRLGYNGTRVINLNIYIMFWLCLQRIIIYILMYI